jgi:periplasmic protein CpxP/Spy
MKFRPIYLLVAAPLVLGAVVPFALAQTDSTSTPNSGQVQPGERRERSQEKRQQRLDRMIQGLGLTQEQQTKIKSIWDNAKNDKGAQRDQIRTEMETMRSLIAKSASTNELRQQHAKLKAIKDQMGDRRFETMLQMYEVLTPEQRTKFAETMQKRGRWGHRGHRKGDAPQAFLPMD